MHWDVHHTSKVKNQWTAQTVERFDNVPYNSGKWDPAIMTLFNGKEHGMPNLTSMTSNP